MNSSQAQKLLEQIRQSYLLELPSKCDEIENMILVLKGDFKPVFDELYRRVHSMKGSAGTHGLTMVSTICHELEDHLTLVNSGENFVCEAEISIMLRLLDLVRSAINLAQDIRADFGGIEGELEAVRKASMKNLSPVLLVETGYGGLLAQEALRGLPVQVILEEDGLSALRRLLNTHFICVISAKEVKTLNGMALLAALRASGSRNKNIKSILLTSSVELMKQKEQVFDYVVERNVSFGDDLSEIVSGVIADA